VVGKQGDHNSAILVTMAPADRQAGSAGSGVIRCIFFSRKVHDGQLSFRDRE